MSCLCAVAACALPALAGSLVVGEGATYTIGGSNVFESVTIGAGAEVYLSGDTEIVVTGGGAGPAFYLGPGATIYASEVVPWPTNPDGQDGSNGAGGDSGEWNWSTFVYHPHSPPTYTPPANIDGSPGAAGETVPGAVPHARMPNLTIRVEGDLVLDSESRLSLSAFGTSDGFAVDGGDGGQGGDGGNGGRFEEFRTSGPLDGTYLYGVYPLRGGDSGSGGRGGNGAHGAPGPRGGALTLRVNGNIHLGGEVGIDANGIEGGDGGHAGNGGFPGDPAYGDAEEGEFGAFGANGTAGNGFLGGAGGVVDIAATGNISAVEPYNSIFARGGAGGSGGKGSDCIYKYYGLADTVRQPPSMTSAGAAAQGGNGGTVRVRAGGMIGEPGGEETGSPENKCYLWCEAGGGKGGRGGDLGENWGVSDDGGGSVGFPGDAEAGGHGGHGGEIRIAATNGVYCEVLLGTVGGGAGGDGGFGGSVPGPGHEAAYVSGGDGGNGGDGGELVIRGPEVVFYQGSLLVADGGGAGDGSVGTSGEGPTGADGSPGGPGVVRMGDVVPRVPDEESAQFGSKQDVPYAAEPVHPGLGNYVFSHTLFALPGRGLPLAFGLVYNSRANAQPGPVGYGWTHAYNVTLSVTGDTKVVTWGDGSTDVFRRDTNTAAFVHSIGAHRLSLADQPGGAHRVTEPGGVVYSFDAMGRLTRCEDAYGNAVVLTHSTALDQIVDTAGRAISLSYTGSLLRAVSVAGVSAALEHDAAGNLTAFSDLRGAWQRFTYDGEHRVLTQSDALGRVATRNRYDDEGRVVEQVNALGQTMTFAYDDSSGSNRTVTIVGPGGYSVRHVYDDAYRIRRITDPEGGVAEFVYDAAGRRVRAGDKRGADTTVRFDGAGSPTSLVTRAGASAAGAYGTNGCPVQVVDALGRTHRFACDARGRVTNIVDAAGQSHAIGRNAAGQIVRFRDPAGRVWAMGRNAQGLLTSVTNPLGGVATVTYDALGRVAGATAPAGGGSVQVKYDAAGNVTNFVDALGHETRAVYDAAGNLLSRTHVASGATVAYRYNALNQVTGIVDTAGAVMRFDYDAAGRVARVTDADGVSRSVAYDANGRRVGTADVEGRGVGFGYDVNGNVESATNRFGGGWQYRYDAEDRLVAATGPDGLTVSNVYDVLGRRIASVDGQGRDVLRRSFDALGRVTNSVAPDGTRVSLFYGPAGLVTGVTDRLGRRWDFAYDSLGRSTRVRNPAGEEAVYAYNDAARTVSVTLGGGKTTVYTRDTAGRFVRVQPPEGGAFVLTYDAAGNVARVTGPGGTAGWAYDRLNRVTAYTNRYGYAMRYGYTAAGRLHSVTYPGNRTVTYRYDAAGRLTNTVDWAGHAATYEYDALNRLTAVTQPNGTRQRLAYDARNRVTALRHEAPDGSALEAYALQYNAAGQLVSRTATGAFAATPVPGETWRWEYDVAGRAWRGAVGGVTNRYAFDAQGHMTQRVERAAATRFTYDALGRLTGGTCATQTVAYAYDAWGSDPAARTTNGRETRFLCDGGVRFCDLDSAGNVQRYYVHAGALCYSLDAAGNARVYHEDERGSVTGVTGPAGALQASYAYTPYGRLAAAVGALTNDVAYLGLLGPIAEPLGLLRLGERFYDPESGRFLTEDPIGLEGGLSPYGYAGGDPVNLSDPSGLKNGLIRLPQQVTPVNQFKMIDIGRPDADSAANRFFRIGVRPVFYNPPVIPDVTYDVGQYTRQSMVLAETVPSSGDWWDDMPYQRVSRESIARVESFKAQADLEIERATGRAYLNQRQIQAQVAQTELYIAQQCEREMLAKMNPAQRFMYSVQKNVKEIIAGIALEYTILSVAGNASLSWYVTTFGVGGYGFIAGMCVAEFVVVYWITDEICYASGLRDEMIWGWTVYYRPEDTVNTTRYLADDWEAIQRIDQKLLGLQEMDGYWGMMQLTGPDWYSGSGSGAVTNEPEGEEP